MQQMPGSSLYGCSMDSIRNPFAPGTNMPPPELARRDELLAALNVALARARIGRPAKSAMLVGLRGADKTDKSSEVFKFYVNALYVAITRARLNVILVEGNSEHALLHLLAVRADAAASSTVALQRASRDEWQREAHRLEQQGKLEQAAAIRATVLRETKVPWPVLDEPRLRDLRRRVFVENPPGRKPVEQLRELCAVNYVMELELQLARATTTYVRRHAGNAGTAAKYFTDFGKHNFKEVLQRRDQYGVDHRTPMGTTPLMNAAAMGNVPLVDALMQRGADIEVRDVLHRQAIHHALQRARFDEHYAQDVFAAVYDRVAPARLDFSIDGRLVRRRPLRGARAPPRHRPCVNLQSGLNANGRRRPRGKQPTRYCRRRGMTTDRREPERERQHPPPALAAARFYMHAQRREQQLQVSIYISRDLRSHAARPLRVAGGFNEAPARTRQQRPSPGDRANQD